MTTGLRAPAGGETRRGFLKKTATTAVAVAGANLLQSSVIAQPRSTEITIVPDSADALVQQPPVRWAIDQLRDALKAKGVAAQVVERLAQTPPNSECIVVGSFASSLARQVIDAAGASVPDSPETLGLVRG
jgi:hypothetical protein